MADRFTETSVNKSHLVADRRTYSYIMDELTVFWFPRTGGLFNRGRFRVTANRISEFLNVAACIDSPQTKFESTKFLKKIYDTVIDGTTNACTAILVFFFFLMFEVRSVWSCIVTFGLLVVPCYQWEKKDRRKKRFSSVLWITLCTFIYYTVLSNISH